MNNRQPIPAFLGIAAALVLAIICGSTTTLHAGVASFQGLGDLPGGEFFSEAFGISGDGQVVVGWSHSTSDHQAREAFRWTATEGMVGLNNPGADPAVYSRAIAASHDGSVIVGRRDLAFLWTAEDGMVFLDDLTPGDLNAFRANGVSADGSVIVGNALGDTPMEAYRWTAQSGAVGLGFLAEAKVMPDSSAAAVSADGLIVTGQGLSGPPDVEAFRWTLKTGMVGLGGLTKLPLGFSYALGFGISADGSTIVGQARTVEFEEAFRWTAETGLESLDPLHGTTFFSTARDASADGSIIVGLGEGFRAMIWDEVHGMRDLQDLLENEHGLDLSGWTLGTVYGISDDGTHLAGNGINPKGDREAWLATLPRTNIPGQCDADVNGDGVTNVLDLIDLLLCFGLPATPGCETEDVNEDGTVNVLDLIDLLLVFGAMCP